MINDAIPNTRKLNKKFAENEKSCPLYQIFEDTSPSLGLGYFTHHYLCC